MVGMDFLKIIVASAVLILPEKSMAEIDFDPTKAFVKTCSLCHGVHGDAKTPLASSMNPPPTDFSSPDVQKRLTLETIITVISKGVKGTAMPGWSGRYTKNEIKALAQHILTHFMKHPVP
ncbi:MAG: cytochrome c [Magnetococcales bacterium]|nr:cytochrome c [Magnetococcales bacterium]